MKRSPAAMVLCAMALLTVAAPWLAPAPADRQEDVAGARLLAPWTRASAVPIRGGRTFVLLGLHRVQDGWEGTRAGQALRIPDGDVGGAPAARIYLLGTDSLGRDLASQLLYALRHSMILAGLAVALSLAIGIAVGAASGWAGGWTDQLVMRGVDVLLSVPRLAVFLLLAALFHPSFLLLVLVLGGTTWPGLARLVRGEVLSRRRGDLAVAARAAGCSAPRILWAHVLPQVAPLIAVTAALRFADTIVLEAALSFLGLGAPAPVVSLGGMIAMGRDDFARGWWIAVWPTAALSILVLVMRSSAAKAFVDPPSVA